MNERMIKLYQQALEFAHENVSKEIWNTDNFHAIVAGKFAELIVKECVKVAMRSVSDDEPKEAWYLIQEHFGVEE